MATAQRRATPRKQLVPSTIITWSSAMPTCSACGQRWCIHTLAAIRERQDTWGTIGANGCDFLVPVASKKYGGEIPQIAVHLQRDSRDFVTVDWSAAPEPINLGIFTPDATFTRRDVQELAVPRLASWGFKHQCCGQYDRADLVNPTFRLGLAARAAVRIEHYDKDSCWECRERIGAADLDDLVPDLGSEKGFIF